MKGDLTVGLGDSVEDSVGDSVGGFVIGDADITIWRGVNGVGALPLLAVPEVPRGPFPVYHCRLMLVRSSSCHPVPFGASCYLRSVGGLSRDSTAPPSIRGSFRVSPYDALTASIDIPCAVRCLCG